MKANIKVAFTSPQFKVLLLSGKKGDTLKKHKVDEHALLLIKNGSLIYQEGEKHLTLSSGEAHQIPANKFHEVTCTESTEAFVIMTPQTKMRFEK